MPSKTKAQPLMRKCERAGVAGLSPIAQNNNGIKSKMVAIAVAVRPASRPSNSASQQSGAFWLLMMRHRMNQKTKINHAVGIRTAA
jgi:hypothetical protein